MSENDDDMSADMKNDILLAFNLFKNENNKISKLKLRTMLFSFVMYKRSSNEINNFIEEITSPDQEYFSYDEVCKLVKFKLKNAKEREADEIFNYIVGKEVSNKISEDDINKAFKPYNIDMGTEEIREMLMFMNEDSENEDYNDTQKLKVTRMQFKKFYTNSK